MNERIDITVDEKIIAQNEEKHERLRATHNFEKADRTPVFANLNQYSLLGGRGSTFADYIKSPEENLREQILNRKWKIENVNDDSPIPLEKWHFNPDVGCIRGIEFEMEMQWLKGESPKCIHPLTEPEQIDDMEVPEPPSGLQPMYIEWAEKMRKYADTLDLRINGRRIEISVSTGQWGGPIPAAFALAGENMLMWMLTDPERMHRLMEITTESHLKSTRFFDEKYGVGKRHGFSMGCDTAEMLSPELYREFVTPYYNRIYETYPGSRGMHMCGKIDHLLEIIRDEMKLNSLNGFGFPTDRNGLAEEFSGRVSMSGGPSPMMVHDGPIDEIKKECISYIETVGRESGFILQTGGGVTVGTPLEHLHAMVEASKEAAETVSCK